MARILVPDSRSVLGLRTVETPDDDTGDRTADPPASGAGDVPLARPDDFGNLLLLLRVVADPKGTEARLRAIQDAQVKLEEREAALAKAAADFSTHVEKTRQALAAEIELAERRLAETAPQELSELRASVGELASKLVGLLGKHFPDRLSAEESLTPLQKLRLFFALEPGPVEGVRLVLERKASWAYQDEHHAWGGGEELRGDLTRAPYVEPQYSDPPIGLPSLPRNIELPPIKGVVVRSTVAARRAQRRAAEKQRRGAAA